MAMATHLPFSSLRYNYDSLKVGLVLVSFGGGNIMGSILGGRYSDFMLAKLKKANGGVSEPEMRLKSMFPAIPVMIASFLGYAWTAEEKVRGRGQHVLTLSEPDIRSYLRFSGSHRCASRLLVLRRVLADGHLRECPGFYG